MTPDEQSIEDGALAGEFALGVLEGDELALALRRMLAEPDFAAAVERWRERIGPLFAETAEVEAPATLWPSIERALDVPEAANDNAVIARLRRWRAGAFVSTGLAASLAAVLAFGQAETVPIAPAAPARPMVAQLAPEGAPATLLAAWDADRGMVRIMPAALPTRGMAPQLWLIPADGTPRSLGMIRMDAMHDMPVTPEQRAMMSEAVTLAVSLEPEGGSPTGLPTGPVVASGKFSAI